MKAKKQARVSQHDLAEIERLRRFKARLANELKTIDALLSTHENQVLAQLVAGARVVAGDLNATLEEKTVCNPKYKDELIAHFEQSHGISGKLVEQQVQERWSKKKVVLAITHTPKLSVVRH